MEFNFDNVSEKGYTIVPAGTYDVTTAEWWLRKKEETGNLVIDMDLTITGGEYDGENIRYFHTITQEEKTKGFLLGMLKSVGIVSEDDRQEGNKLRVEFVYGEKDDKGRAKITAVKVNGEDREVEGIRSTAIVVSRKNAMTGEMQSNVQKLTAAEENGNGVAPEKAKNPHTSKDKMPF